MSLQPAQPRPLQRVASRRTVVRGAAWTTAAVTVVVATPNIAAASTAALKPSVSVAFGTPEKYSVQNTKYVAWDIDVTSSNMDLTGLQLQLTYNQTGGGGTSTVDEVVVQSFAPSGSAWTASVGTEAMPASATATYTGIIAQGTTGHIHVQFRGSDNSAGKVSATLLAHDSSGRLVVIGGTTDPLTWVSGTQHSH